MHTITLTAGGLVSILRGTESTGDAGDIIEGETERQREGYLFHGTST